MRVGRLGTPGVPPLRPPSEEFSSLAGAVVFSQQQALKVTGAALLSPNKALSSQVDL